MEQIVNYFALHPAVLGVSVIVAAVVMFFFLRKLAGLLLLAAAVVVLYAAWLLFSGSDVSPIFHKAEGWLTTALQFVSSLFGS
ncbi:hypothetical protein EKD00_04675 [Chlorobium phaeovibrioides]|uniref:Uncharacterized protein n=2 Tax=Chlorobium phaeovibrioides TaxID=1094 RepID=A0A5M8I8D3_CHLPH|nr:hypothetical protein [Chlorobium phaeovibrioides]KAA6230652.1 hypothetical protein FP507_10430 [Chlorobium phaeovibrioides]MWV54375.1 hypothetical protein [Chlorobium phaeovibrioides]RTY35766.1 hypothetical protein EKD00_04675 [Chlorobium phaeovibrioides]HCD35971.1 hypothetical protein [Chlorobium sp.]